MLTLDDSRPTYLQVADVLRSEIKAGQLGPGERLPSVRDLATRFDVAAVTVQSALRVLRDEALVVARSTRGYYVRDVLPEPSEEGASPEYLAMRQQLGAVEELIRDLADRVSHLEALVGQAAAEGPPDTSSPANEPDGSSPPSRR